MAKTTTIITNVNLNMALDNSVSYARENLVSKIAVVKGIQYNPKKVRITATKAYAAMISEAYAFKTCVYDVDSKSRNNIAYHNAEIEKLINKDTLTPQEEKRLALHIADRARTQAGLRAFTKAQRATVQPILADIASRLYDAYAMRMKDAKGWKAALSAYFESYEMRCDNSLVTFLSDNVGSRVARVKDWHSNMVDNMTPQAFADLFLACLLQLAVDKSMISMKIVESTLDGAKAVLCEDTDKYLYIKGLDATTATIADYRKVLEECGAELPKSDAKKADYVKAYRQAKKVQLFVEY